MTKIVNFNNYQYLFLNKVALECINNIVYSNDDSYLETLKEIKSTYNKRNSEYIFNYILNYIDTLVKYTKEDYNNNKYNDDKRVITCKSFNKTLKKYLDIRTFINENNDNMNERYYISR